MDRTLLFGCADSSENLTANHVRKALETLPETGRKLILSKRRLFYLAAALCCSAAVFLYSVNNTRLMNFAENTAPVPLQTRKTAEKQVFSVRSGKITIHDVVIRQNRQQVETAHLPGI
jgi:hypothetical protein